jgi:ribosome recycling factor
MIDEILKKLEENLKDVEKNFAKEIAGLRSNRVSPELVENIKVNVYNQILTIKQLAAISIKSPKTLQLTFWDKNAIAPAAKAIEEANIGFSPVIDGLNVYLNLPELTNERRQEFIKLAKKITEETKIKIRNKRDEEIKKIKNLFEDKKISEDDMFKSKEKIQKIIDEINKNIDLILENKIKEINS